MCFRMFRRGPSLSVPLLRVLRIFWSAYKSMGCATSKVTPDGANGRSKAQFIQELDARDSPQLQERLLSLLELLLVAAASKPVELPLLEHKSRLPSGERGLSLEALRAVRTFYERRRALGKVMGDVCKKRGFKANVCALTSSTGLSLAESLVHVAGKNGVDVSELVGSATTFFSYSWTGTKLGDMLDAVERALVRLAAEGRPAAFVWVDMCALYAAIAPSFRYHTISTAHPSPLTRRCAHCRTLVPTGFARRRTSSPASTAT